MSNQLIWTPIAEEDYALILEYIENKYGTDASLRFLDKTEDLLLRIQKFPFIYPISNRKKGIRKAVIDKNNSLLYTFNKDDIWILEFLDNRQG